MSSLAAWLHDGPVQNLIVADQELAAGDVERARAILRATIADLRGALADGPREPVTATGDDVLLSVARELNVLFSDVRRCAAKLDVWPVRFEHPGHRVLTAPVIVIVVAAVVIVVPVTHPLVVLTVSHVSPLFQP